MMLDRTALSRIIVYLALILLPLVIVTAYNHPPPDEFAYNLGRAFALTAFAILIAPFMEELIFRGIVFLFFENLVGPRFAIVGTALLFASLHVPEYWGAWNHMLLILFVGLVFSLARGLTGFLTPSVLLHVAYNAALMVGLYYQTAGFRNLGILGQP